MIIEPGQVLPQNLLGLYMVLCNQLSVKEMGRDYCQPTPVFAKRAVFLSKCADIAQQASENDFIGRLSEEDTSDRRVVVVPFLDQHRTTKKHLVTCKIKKTSQIDG
jgi:hypothetical protein